MILLLTHVFIYVCWPRGMVLVRPLNVSVDLQILTAPTNARFCYYVFHC